MPGGRFGHSSTRKGRSGRAALTRLISSAVSAATAAALATALAAPAGAQDSKSSLTASDLPTVMSAYIDSVIELRQFQIACGPGDGTDWQQGAIVLVASLKAIGLDAGTAGEFTNRLASAAPDGVRYDCAGKAATERLEIPPVKDWVAFYSQLLGWLDIPVVNPPSASDPKLVAVRAVVARHAPAQARMLSCMALLYPNFFPQSYGDWNTLVMDAMEAVRTAGFDAAMAEEIVGPAHSGRLFLPLADRQAGIADCVADDAWMDRSSTFQWYAFAGDVREALGQPR